MRRILFTVLASCVVLAAVPVIATARSGEHHRGRHHEQHHRRHHERRHHERRHQARVHHEHFNGDRGDRNDNPGEEGTAGTVTSFNNGVLTITLNDGNVVSGQVTPGTELRCEMREPEFGDDDQGPGGGDNGGGDNGGGDNGGNGDGRGGPGPGDDRGDNNDEMCATVAPGMTVERAELRISSAGAFWEEVELTS